MPVDPATPYRQLVDDDDSPAEQTSCSTSFFQLIVPSLANLSASYNFGIVIFELQSEGCGITQLPWVTPATSGAAFIGAVTGQIVLGYAGDIIGRRKGMMITLSLIILGALASGLLTWGPHKLVLLCVFRFILGIGLGGVYPLSAVSVGENSTPKQRSRKVAITFSYQVWGGIVLSLVVAACLYAIPSDEWKWRTMAFLGACPSILTLPIAALEKDSAEFLTAKAKHSEGKGKSSSPLVALRDPATRNKLIGTAVGWFFFDITGYGEGVFTPYILEKVLRVPSGSGTGISASVCEANLAEIALWSAVLGCVGIPGVGLSIWLVSDENWGRKKLQVAGFICMAVFNVCLGVAFLAGGSESTLFFFFIMVTFSNWFGASVTTYLLPQETFPAEIRSTMNGLSAACGKIGGAIGTAVFQPLVKASPLKLAAALFVCAAAGVCGVLVTIFFVVDVRAEHEYEKDTCIDSSGKQRTELLQIKHQAYVYD